MRYEIEAVVAIPEIERREALLSFLRSRDYSERSSGAGDSSVAHLISPCEAGPEIPVDLHFASLGVESELVTEAERLEVVSGAVVPVARTSHLLATNLGSGRDSDRYAALVLKEFAEKGDPAREAPASFLEATARLNLEGPEDWSSNLD